MLKTTSVSSHFLILDFACVLVFYLHWALQSQVLVAFTCAKLKWLLIVSAALSGHAVNSTSRSRVQGQGGLVSRLLLQSWEVTPEPFLSLRVLPDLGHDFRNPLLETP